MEDQEKIYTIDEVCAYFKVHRNTLYRWVKEGQLEAVKFGRALRFTQTAISKFVQSQSTVQ